VPLAYSASMIAVRKVRIVAVARLMAHLISVVAGNRRLRRWAQVQRQYQTDEMGTDHKSIFFNDVRKHDHSWC